MSNFLGRRTFDEDEDEPEPAESVLRKPGYVTSHRGSFFDFEDRLRAHINSVLWGGWQNRKNLANNLLDFISDERNMAIAWHHVREHGGRAAGSDGVTFADFGPDELPWTAFSGWRSGIRKGEFVPDPDRVCLIPKGGGRGDRRITVLTIRDRVINRAAVQVLQAAYDRFFDSFSFGCRPSPRTQGALRRGQLPAVATALALFDRGYTHWVSEDLKDAFGRVPLVGVLEVFGKYLGVKDAADHKLTLFIDALLCGASGPGLRQGSPLSAFLLNCYLDHHLDREWRKRHPQWPLVRYVDDLLVVCRTRAEAVAAHGALTELLRPRGMLTKHGRQKAVRALDGRRPVGWLGFYFHRTRAGSLRVRPAEGAWEALAVALTEPGLTTDAAMDRMVDWLNAYAPAYEHCNRRLVYDRLAALATEVGINDFPERDEVLDYWQTGHARWHKLKYATGAALIAQRLLPEPVTATA